MLDIDQIAFLIKEALRPYIGRYNNEYVRNSIEKYFADMLSDEAASELPSDAIKFNIDPTHPDRLNPGNFFTAVILACGQYGIELPQYEYIAEAVEEGPNKDGNFILEFDDFHISWNPETSGISKLIPIRESDTIVVNFTLLPDGTVRYGE